MFGQHQEVAPNSAEAHRVDVHGAGHYVLNDIIVPYLEMPTVEEFIVNSARRIFNHVDNGRRITRHGITPLHAKPPESPLRTNLLSVTSSAGIRVRFDVANKAADRPPGATDGHLKSEMAVVSHDWPTVPLMLGHVKPKIPIKVADGPTEPPYYKRLITPLPGDCCPLRRSRGKEYKLGTTNHLNHSFRLKMMTPCASAASHYCAAMRA